jgi:hypothetical protein
VSVLPVGEGIRRVTVAGICLRPVTGMAAIRPTTEAATCPPAAATFRPGAAM